MARPRVLLADDHALLLGAFEKLLSPECDIVGQVSDGRALVAAALELEPDLVVLDIGMPGLNGLEAARQIKQRQPHIKLVFLTMNEDNDVAADAFRAGASAYLLKRSAASELSKAIREAMLGRSYVTPLVVEGMIGSLLQTREQPPVDELTPRQREVLHLLAGGHSMKEAAAALSLTARTVAFHKYRMMAQLKIRSTAALIRYAVDHDLV